MIQVSDPGLDLVNLLSGHAAPDTLLIISASPTENDRAWFSNSLFHSHQILSYNDIIIATLLAENKHLTQNWSDVVAREPSTNFRKCLMKV